MQRTPITQYWRGFQCMTLHGIAVGLDFESVGRGFESLRAHHQNHVRPGDMDYRYPYLPASVRRLRQTGLLHTRRLFTATQQSESN